jgi:hypothetical protein
MGSEEEYMSPYARSKVCFGLLAFCYLSMISSCGEGNKTVAALSSSFAPKPKVVSTTTFNSGIIDNVTSDLVGNYNSIAIDPDDNNPAVAYFDAGNSQLMYAKWDGNDWDDKAVADSAYGVGGSTSLAFDSSGNPSIAYYDFENQALKWVYDHDDDGDWDESY